MGKLRGTGLLIAKARRTTYYTQYPILNLSPPRLPDEVFFSIEATKYQAKEERHQCVPGVKHTDDIKNEVQDFRGEIEKYCMDQYRMATTTARKAGIEASVLCIVSR